MLDAPIPRIGRKIRIALNLLRLRSRKVFAVGFNKTGTKSLHGLFTSMGLPSFHGKEWRDCSDLRLLRKYDCFSDGTPGDPRILDEAFPGSRFVLQVRNLDSWVYSRLAHIRRAREIGRFQWTPEWNESPEAVRSWIVTRTRYHLSVMNYFEQRPDDLLLINFVRDRDAHRRDRRVSRTFDRFREAS